jgi:Flp pilus assembly protein TadG
MHRARERGAAAVEFALVLPILLFIVLGAIDWGHYFMVEQIAVNAAREGARVGSLHAPEAPDAPMLADAETTASAYLSRAGLDVTRATVTAVPGAGSVVVQVSYRTGSITGFLDLVPLMPTSANATAEMRR